ncbi:MAG TPA: sigma-54 dependent transcriptional regulator [Polyangiaceae bacterium]
MDDDADMRELVEAALAPSGHTVSSCSSGEAALELLEANDFDVLVVDHQMSGMTGVELCRHACRRRPNTAVILLTGFGSLEIATEALRAGAYDFVTKPVALEVLLITIERAVTRQMLKRELGRLREAAPTRFGILGGSSAMKQVLDTIAQVARSEVTVLIQGETGTGKELVARALHEQSGRTGPFVPVNCSAMVETLLESELFGHMPGAFTDARKARTGLFVDAGGGTLFLDEIGEMGLGMQSKLLRALQERVVRPLGGSREVPFETRIVAATNRDLEAEVAVKRFREDLFYRVNVVKIDVPPLRVRMEDILPLAQHFIERAAGSAGPAPRLSESVAERLMAHDWPGNVRELENAMARAVAVARFDQLVVEDLPPQLLRATGGDGALPTAVDAELTTMQIVEDRYIQKVLAAVGGNKAAAARVLGFEVRTLYRKLAHLAGDTSTSPDESAPVNGQAP